MKQKRLLLLTMVFLTCFFAKAQSPSQQLVVCLKAGEKVYFDLAQQPETTFEDGKLIITTDNSTVSYHLENVLRYTFEGDVTAISSPKIQPGQLRYSQGNDVMKFEGLPEGTRLELYSTDGKLLSVHEAQDGKATVIYFSGMPSGTYILKANDATIKFLKR